MPPARDVVFEIAAQTQHPVLHVEGAEDAAPHATELQFGEESSHKLSSGTSLSQRLAIYPNLSDSGRAFIPGNNLYHFRVMVFRAFVPWTDEKVRQEGHGPDPIYEMEFEVAK